MSQTQQQDFFADADTPNRYYLPDQVSFIEHKRLDEGAFQRYQDLTSNVKLGRDGETTEIDMKLGAQREFLFYKLVTGWNLVAIEKTTKKDDEGKDVTEEVRKAIPFSHQKLLKLPPHLLTGLIEDIYKKNPILSGETEEDAEGKAE